MHTGKAQSHPVGNTLPRYYFNNNSNTGYADWSGCRKCSLSLGRRYVAVRRDGCTARPGSSPTRLLFIGDRPERGDSFTGRPFTGVSGRIVDTLLEFVPHSIQYCMTNLVCCPTRDIVRIYGLDGKEILCTEQDEAESAIDMTGVSIEATNFDRPPTRAEASLCSSHIDELLQSFKPRGIVFLGLLPIAYYRTRLPYVKLFGNSITEFTKKEYKLLPLKLEARKLSTFIKELSQ